MTGADGKKRKNAREAFRVRTDAELVVEELDRAQRIMRELAAKLVPHHELEMDERAPEPTQDGQPSGAILGEALHAIGRAKGRMYLERVAAGLSVKDICGGSGWSEHTLRQFENRESDAMVSSLFRYAAGLRAAGVPGHIEIRWVADRTEAKKGLKAA